MVDASYAFTSLIAGDVPLPHRTITLAAAATPQPRGAVLGMIAVGAATSAVKASGANTGNGTLVLDPTSPVLLNARPGLYQVRFTSATAFTDGSRWRLPGCRRQRDVLRRSHQVSDHRRRYGLRGWRWVRRHCG